MKYDKPPYYTKIYDNNQPYSIINLLKSIH